MQEHKRSQSVFVILAALIILAALWRVLSYEPGARTNVSKKEKQSAVSTVQEKPTPSSKYDEFLGEPAPAPRSQTARVAPANFTVSASNQPVFITEKQPYVSAAAPLQNPRQSYPSRRTGADSGRVVNTNFYTPERGPSAAPQAVATSARTGVAAAPNVTWNNTSAAVQEERAGRILAPFMRTNRKDQERMNAQWAKLSAAIDRAVFQALMPKAKKEALIEKYAPAQQQGAAADPVMQSSGLTGAFAPVGNAIASQKQEIMRNFGSAFGGRAAQQAGSLMDAFAGELGAALNTPGLTQDQASKRVQEISKKYQDKMNKLSEQKQRDKFQAERLAQDNAQKEALHNLYPDGQVSEQINGLIDTASQKIQVLAQRTDLTQEEQSAQYAQIEQEKRDGIQNAIVQSGQSLNPFYKWEQQQAEKDLANIQSKIEKGEIESVSRPATAKEINDMRASVKTQREGFEADLLKDPRFGQAAVEEVAPILNNYEQQLNQLYQAQLSPDERRKQEIELIKNVNRQLLQKRMEQVEQMNLPEAQKQHALDEIQKAYDNIR